jgi:ATP-dependent Clp protease ATP-binding subunit ClpA
MDLGSSSPFDQLVDKVVKTAATPDPIDRLDTAIIVADEVTATGERLLDHFVAQARAAGISWTDIGARLGVSKQAARQRFADRTEPLTLPNSARPAARLQACLERAAEDAQSLGATQVDTHHLLTGLLAEGIAAAILEQLGVTSDAIHDASHRLFGPPGHARDEPPPMSSEAMTALQAAAYRAATATPDSPQAEVRTEHLLSVLALDPGSRARRVLNDLGVDIAALKRELARYVAGQPRQRASRWKRSPGNVGRSCSFCGRSEKVAGHLVAGPAVHICASCVALADQILCKRAAS